MSPGYFQTFGVHIVKGRGFTDQDTASSVRVAMVNENSVQRYLKGADPIGQRIAIDQLIPGVAGVGPTVEWEIVVYLTTCEVLVRGPRTYPKSMCRSHKVPGHKRTWRSAPLDIPRL